MEEIEIRKSDRETSRNNSSKRFNMFHGFPWFSLVFLFGGFSTEAELRPEPPAAGAAGSSPPEPAAAAAATGNHTEPVAQVAAPTPAPPAAEPAPAPPSEPASRREVIQDKTYQTYK